MPRPNPPRTIHSEENLRRRIALEREERGQSYETLAGLMTELGCAIPGSALHKIEKGKPPRKVAVDELIALSEVWGLPVLDLLMPLELRNQQRAQELTQDLVEGDHALTGVMERLF